jgi:hypothetical protein
LRWHEAAEGRTPEVANEETNMRHVGVKWSVVLLATLLAAAQAQGTPSAPEIVYTFTGEALEGPEQIEAGFHTIAFQNDGEVVADMDVVRLADGVTPDEVIATFRAADEMGMADGDYAAVVEAFLTVGDLWGGRVAEPGGRDAFGIDLEPGRYAVVSRYHHYPEALEIGFGYLVRPLDVSSAAERTPPPPVDLTVQLVDFAFAMPSEIPAGPQQWHVVNLGEQVHHIALMKLLPGMTVDDVTSFLETEEGEPPVEFLASTSILSAGSSNYLALDLEPGAYFAACFLPDHRNGTGEPHFLMGMTAALTVVGD